MWETQVQSLGQEDPPEKEMAPHSSTLAWKIPWMKEPGGLQSLGLQSRTRLSDFTSLLCVWSCTTSRAKAINHLHFHMKLYCKSFLPIGFPQQQKILCPGERSCLTGFFFFFPLPQDNKRDVQKLNKN